MVLCLAWHITRQPVEVIGHQGLGVSGATVCGRRWRDPEAILRLDIGPYAGARCAVAALVS